MDPEETKDRSGKIPIRALLKYASIPLAHHDIHVLTNPTPAENVMDPHRSPRREAPPLLNGRRRTDVETTTAVEGEGGAASERRGLGAQAMAR